MRPTTSGRLAFISFLGKRRQSLAKLVAYSQKSEQFTFKLHFPLSCSILDTHPKLVEEDVERKKKKQAEDKGIRIRSADVVAFKSAIFI